VIDPFAAGCGYLAIPHLTLPMSWGGAASGEKRAPTLGVAGDDGVIHNFFLDESIAVAATTYSFVLL
jgi:hypothetical protein